MHDTVGEKAWEFIVLEMLKKTPANAFAWTWNFQGQSISLLHLNHLQGWNLSPEILRYFMELNISHA